MVRGSVGGGVHIVVFGSLRSEASDSSGRNNIVRKGFKIAGDKVARRSDWDRLSFHGFTERSVKYDGVVSRNSGFYLSIEDESEVSVSLGSAIVEVERIETSFAHLLRAISTSVTRITITSHGNISIPKEIIVGIVISG